MNTLYHGEIVISKDRKVKQAKKILEEYREVFHYEIETNCPYEDTIIYKCPDSYPPSIVRVLKELIQRFQKNKIYIEICFSYTGFGNSSEKIFYHYGTEGIISANRNLLDELS